MTSTKSPRQPAVEDVTATVARARFAELLNRAEYAGEITRIMRDGRVAGAIIGPEDLARLTAA